MNIYNPQDCPYNFSDKFQPLFDAMKNGATIKRITCMGGRKYKNDRTKDFVIEYFKATEYTVAFGRNSETNEYVDLVWTDAPEYRPGRKCPYIDFYMHWVISFEL